MNDHCNCAPVGGCLDLEMEQLQVVEAVSPVVALTRKPNGTEITVTDVQGTRSSMVYDGAARLPVASMDETPLLTRGTIIEAQGAPVYVSDLTASTWRAFQLTETGWYIFAVTSTRAMSCGQQASQAQTA